VLAHGRLREVPAPGKVQLLRDGDEVPEVSQFHSRRSARARVRVRVRVLDART
jgi:hypothetical protein